jgi:hypothetical protein
MRRLRLGAHLCTLTMMLTMTAVLVGPAHSATLGPGTPPSRDFSGYVARNGAELGIARLPDGTWGICLDTGTRWRWPTSTPPARNVVDPIVGYLTATYLERAQRAPVLAAALWWAVGERLNSHPRAVRAHVRQLRRESPGIGRRVTTWHRRMVSEAARLAPPTGGYVMPAPTLTRAELTASGVRSRSGAWVPGLRTQITLRGATFDDHSSTWNGVTGAAPLKLSVHPSGPVTVSAQVSIVGMAPAAFRLFSPRRRHRQRVASSVPPTSVSTGADVAFVPARPRVSTRVSLQRAQTGVTLTDRVSVAGLSTEPGAPPVPIVWELRGPVRADRASTCRAVSWAGAPLTAAGSSTVTRDGTVTLGATRLGRGGCYSYRERLLPTPYSLGTAWTPLGLVEETSLLIPPAPRIPRHPAVSSGGESAGPVSPGRSSGAATVAAPAIGLRAPLSRVDFVGRTITPPRAIDSAGLWSRGAALDDVVGTTVLVGHVSDRHDRPGAFHRLLRARVGQSITLQQGGRTSSWRISAVRRVDRTRLSPAPFRQQVARRLVLITCAGRVTTSTGGFHYAKNLIIEAVPR